MRKRKLRLAIAILLLAVLGCLTWLVFSSIGPREPVYQGKRLSEWLSQSMDGIIADSRAEEAVRQIGTNGIPTLLRMVRACDSKFKIKIVELVQKQHFIKFNFEVADRRNAEAATAFHWLGATASNAVPALIKIHTENICELSQWSAATSLGWIGPPATAAIATLLNSAADTNAGPYARDGAVWALGRIQAKPELVVPILVQCLKDPEPGIRMEASLALGAFGGDAKEAVPALIGLLKDPYSDVKADAETALKAIDSQAAAKASIK